MGRVYPIVTIIGTGLLGGSLGLGLKRAGMAGRIRGVGRRQSPLDTALALGAIDEASSDPGAAVRDADLVVVCTPAALVIPTLDSIRDAVSSGAIVTDVASTKADICAHAEATWPKPLRFVGSHPMAGSEKFGPEHSTADLYEGTVCLVEEGGDIDPAARAAVLELWIALGATVVDIDPAAHDQVVARTSHVPHIAATALSLLADSGEDVRPFVGNGFRDATRIADGRPEIWRDICLTNSPAIRGGLAELIRSLQALSAAIESGDSAQVESFFERGREARRRVAG